MHLGRDKMIIYTITTRENQFEQWSKIVGDEFELRELNQDNFLNELESSRSLSILMVDLVSCKEFFLRSITQHKALFDNLYIVALSNIPNIHECLGLLSYGIKAYGHNLMDEQLFNEMLQKVSESHMWFPELIMEDVIRVALYSSNQPQKLDSLDVLTPREQEVAYNVAQGKSNKEIAIKLNISSETVKLHLSHIYRKLDIDNRVALALRIKL